jgi:hypothetical protein
MCDEIMDMDGAVILTAKCSLASHITPERSRMANLAHVERITVSKIAKALFWYLPPRGEDDYMS